MRFTRAAGIVKIIRLLAVVNLCARSYTSRTRIVKPLPEPKLNEILFHTAHPDWPDLHDRPSDHKKWVPRFTLDQHVVGELNATTRITPAANQPGQKLTNRHAQGLPSLHQLPQSETLPEASWLFNKPIMTANHTRIIHPPSAMRAIDVPLWLSAWQP
ncbi:hypothetical protein DFS34DRAFT_620182 [Phlyctochytrium arcticum]|nr:hypothetical protein DFS34DRAFT_620182 [Phlyctochytrium arcticum]